MIAAWMTHNNSVQWAEGLLYVQFMKNRASHSGIKQSPYKAMFGIEPRVGLSTSLLSSEIIATLEREKDLEKIVVQVGGSTEGNQSDIECDN